MVVISIQIHSLLPFFTPMIYSVYLLIHSPMLLISFLVTKHCCQEHCRRPKVTSSHCIVINKLTVLSVKDDTEGTFIWISLFF